MSVTSKYGRLTRNGLCDVAFDAPVMRQPARWVFEYDPDQHWPEVPFGNSLTVQILWLTPELAAGWLGKLHERQRNLKELHLASLVRDQQAGYFTLNAEPLIFDRDGRLLDGRHRCEMNP